MTLTPNFEDDNTLSSFGKTIENLLSILESENEIAINGGFKDNYLIVNPGTIQLVIFDKQKGNHSNQIISIDQKETKVVSKVRILAIEINDKQKQSPSKKGVLRNFAKFTGKKHLRAATLFKSHPDTGVLL